MWLQTKLFSKVLTLLALCFMLNACAYTWQKSDSPILNSVLGDGSKTITITGVEHQSMYAWLGYYTRSVVRDEINLRQLAIWKDQGETDYELSVNIPAFRVNSYRLDEAENTLLFSASVNLEIIVRNSVTKTILWRSGVVSYSEQYENPLEENAMREVVTTALQKAIDNMQKSF